jgi:hypothetical protein
MMFSDWGQKLTMPSQPTTRLSKEYIAHVQEYGC